MIKMLAGEDIKKILVRGVNWIGDALMTTPALAALKNNFPQAEIAVLAKPWVAPVYARHPGLDRMIIFEAEGRHKGLTGLLRLAREIRAQGFDLAVIFQNAFQAALIAWLAGVPLRLGYNTDGRGFLLNLRIKVRPEDKQVHQTEYYLRILSRAGLEVQTSPPVFHLSQEAGSKAEARLKSLGLEGALLLGLAPGAAYGPAKMWPAKRFAAAAARILAVKPGVALIFGSKAEAEATRKVKEQLGRLAFDLSGQTDLEEAAALIRRCDLFLTNDTGLMHVAAAVGTPLVAIFGSTDPDATGPMGPRQILLRRLVECAPCFKETCPQPTHRCMELITPEEAAAAGLSLLRRVSINGS